MPGRHILHVDANSFYSSVEMQENPTLRGKRIAVCGSKEDRHGIVLTAGYQAKRMGVKTGMAIWEAQRCCRDLHHRAAALPRVYAVQRLYAGDLAGLHRQGRGVGLDDPGRCERQCGPVRQRDDHCAGDQREGQAGTGHHGEHRRFRQQVTAKLGSDYKKPDAITRIESDNYKEIVYPLPVQDLLYVGHATQRKLNYYGIRTIGQLAQTNPETLHGWFGRWGTRCPPSPAGWDASPVAKQDHVAAVKSVGNSGTTPRDLVNNEDVWLMLLVMSESVAMRMRETEHEMHGGGGQRPGQRPERVCPAAQDRNAHEQQSGDRAGCL